MEASRVRDVVAFYLYYDVSKISLKIIVSVAGVQSATQIFPSPLMNPEVGIVFFFFVSAPGFIRGEGENYCVADCTPSTETIILKLIFNTS